MKKYTYWTRTGPITIDVEDNWVEFLEDLDRVDYNSSHKQHRKSDHRGIQDWTTPKGPSAEDQFFIEQEFDNKMDRLTDLEDAVITLIYKLGQTQAQTAEHLGMTQSAVSKILSRARRKLKEVELK